LLRLSGINITDYEYICLQSQSLGFSLLNYFLLVL
jgi:hypothetical protein